MTNVNESTLSPASVSQEAIGKRDLFLRIQDGLSALIMCVLCLITLVNAATRYFGELSLAFTEEISVFLIVILTLIGAGTAFARNRHLAMTFLVDRAPRRLRLLLRCFGLLASLVMFGILVWFGAAAAWDDFTSEISSSALGLPQWMYSVWIPAICALIVARLAGQLGAAFATRAGDTR